MFHLKIEPQLFEGFQFACFILKYFNEIQKSKETQMLFIKKLLFVAGSKYKTSQYKY